MRGCTECLREHCLFLFPVWGENTRQYDSIKIPDSRVSAGCLRCQLLCLLSKFLSKVSRLFICSAWLSISINPTSYSLSPPPYLPFDDGYR